MINTLEPTLSAELIATLAVGAILVALIVAHWYEMRRDFRALRAEIQGLREDFRSDIQDLRQGIRADVAHVHNDLAGLRRDIQALTVRMARIEGFLVGFFAECGPATTTKSIPD